MRELPLHNRRIYVSLLPVGLRHVVLARPWVAPCMRFLFVGSSRGACALGTSGFLPTSPRGFAVAFGSQFHILASCRGLEPHKFTPMLGVHNASQRIAHPGGFANVEGGRSVATRCRMVDCPGRLSGRDRTRRFPAGTLRWRAAVALMTGYGAHRTTYRSAAGAARGENREGITLLAAAKPGEAQGGTIWPEHANAFRRS